METKNKGLFKDLIKHIKEEKEARMAFFYSLFYFVFIAILLVFGSRAWAQTPAHFTREAKAVELKINPPPQVQGTSVQNASAVMFANR